MCNFLSALVVKNGDVLSHPLLDSHTDLVTYFELPDTNAHIRHFVKVELTPEDWLDPSTWNWRVDEETLPGWWNAEMDAAAQETLRARAAKMILKDGEHKLIIDGCWIVGGTAKIRDVRSGWIRRVQDSAQVSDVRGSAQVSHVRDSAQVSHVRDSAQVSHVGDSARVSHVWDSAQVSHVWDSAQVSHVGDSARVSDVRGSAQVSHVWGLAQVSHVGPNVVLDASAKAHLVETK